MCAALPLQAQNESIKIGFENQDYKSIGVYDTWEHSPFRATNGKQALLEGIAKIVDNIDTEYDAILNTHPNDSKMVLGVQRSRYGSNTFGARVDLAEPFELTPKLKYVHVMIHKPKAGRTMLIGLGKRKDRPGQSSETEQFWVFSTNEVTTDKWVDAVFPIKGAGNIDIHSFVIVPDCEDTNGLTEDFVAYIDNIEVNDNPTTTTSREDYPINFDKKQTYTRDDRGLRGISLGTRSVTAYNNTNRETPVYTHLEKQEVVAKAGEEVSAAINYKGVWMHGYVYIDFNNDGRFTPQVKDGKIIPNSGNELCAYSFLSASDSNDEAGYNSAGETKTGGDRNTLAMPSFVLPDTLKTGFYRMRYKVDWNSADPGGNITASNSILNNGGGIIDIRLNVHEDNVVINHSALNGEVVSADGKKLSQLKIPFGKPFKVKMLPAEGFEFAGLNVRHGYNLAGDSLLHGTRQYVDEFIPREKFAADSTVILPAEMIDGDVSLSGVFVDDRNVLVYEVFYDDKMMESKTIYNAKPGKISMPESLKRDFCTYEMSQTEIKQLPATIRINTTWNGPMKLSNGADTTWYELKVSNKDRWIVYKNAIPNVQFGPKTKSNDAAWGFSGNPYEGIVIFNQAQPSKVLASSSPRNSSNTGGNTYATLEDPNAMETGKTYHWTISNSKYAEGMGFYVSNPEGYTLNYRADGNLAYWTTGRDGGSTFVPSDYTGIAATLSDTTTIGTQAYDLSGHAVGKNYKGVVIKKGKKYIVK